MSAQHTPGPKLTAAQLSAAAGKTFDVPGVINGSARVRFVRIWPTGNVAVNKGNDPESFGPLTVTAECATPLFEAIAQAFQKNGKRSAIAKAPGGAA